MAQFSEEDLTEALDDFILQKPFHSLTVMLQKYSGVADSNDINLDEKEFTNLKSIVNDVHKSITTLGGSNKSLLGFLETIFRAESIIHTQNDAKIKSLQSKEPKAQRDQTKDQTKSQNREQKTDSECSLSMQEEELSRSRDLADKAREEGKIEVLNSIAIHYNFPSTISDVDSLLNDLDQLIAESSSKVVKNIANKFNLPQNANSSNIISLLNEKINNFKNNDGIGLNNKNSEFPPQIEERGGINLLSDSDSSSFDSNRNRNSAYIDPSDPSVTKSQLVTTVKQLRAQINRLNDQIANQDDILRPFGDIPLKTDEIDNIILSDAPLLSKVKNIVSVLSLNVFSSEDLVNTNEKLLALSSSLFRFISSLGSSKAAFTSIYSEAPFEEMRGILVTQAERIQIFLNDNAMGIVSDHSLFEDLIQKSDNFNNNNGYNNTNQKQKNNSLTLMKDILTYLKEYEKPNSNESVQLYMLLMQAVAAADVLRKYAVEAQKAVRSQGADVRQLKDYSKQLEKSIEQQAYETSATIQENNDRADDTVNAVRSVLRNAVVGGKTDIEPIIDSLETLNETAEIADDEYIQSLQTQLAQARQTNRELKKGREDLMKQTKNDLLHLQQEINKMKEESRKRISLKNSENKKLIKALNEANEKIEELSKKENNNNNSNNNNNATASNNVNENNDNNSNNSKNNVEEQKALINEIQEQFKGTKEEYERVISKMKKDIEEYQETKQREFDSTKESFEQLLLKANKEADKAKSKSKDLKNKIRSLEEEQAKYEEKFKILKDAEEEALDQAAKISEKYQEMHNDLVDLESEKERLSSRVESNEKRAETLQNVLKDHHELSESYSKAIEEFDKIRSEMGAEMQSLLSGIATLFPAFVDLSQKLDQKNILEMLQKVCQVVVKSEKFETKLQRKQVILDQIKESIDCEKESDLPAEIVNIQKKHKKSNEETLSKLKENKALQDSRMNFLQIQDWLIRMYVTVTGGVCQDVTTAEMQHSIEDVLISSFDNLILARKLGILKAEKKLLLMPNLNLKNAQKSDKSKLSMRHMLICFMLIIKTKKLAGHMDNAYTFEPVEKNDNVDQEYTYNENGNNLSTTETEDEFLTSPTTNAPLSPINNYGSAFD